VFRRLIRTVLPAGALALALTATGCAGAAGSTTAGESPAHQGSAADLAAAARQYTHVDFDPLASPAEAVRMADLIVTGTVVDIVEGISVEFADPAMEGVAGHFTTFVVVVDRVLAGTGARSGDRVYASVRSSVQTKAEELAALNPKAKTVLVLEDITTWKPHPAAKVVRPAAVPGGARLYAPYPDGLWLQGPRDAQMASVYAERGDLAASFGAPRTVEQFAATLAAAAKQAK
jgi:hypothetical protein